MIRTPTHASSATGETLIFDEEFDDFNFDLWKHEITMVRKRGRGKIQSQRVGLLLVLWRRRWRWRWRRCWCWCWCW